MTRLHQVGHPHLKHRLAVWRAMGLTLWLVAGCQGEAPLLPPVANYGDEEAQDDALPDGDTGDTGEEPVVVRGQPLRPGSPPEVREAEALVMEDLRAQQQQWRSRQLEVANRGAELDALETELETRMTTIAELERRLQAQLGIGKMAQERRDERVSSLADLIATMPPQAGAEIVAQMSDKDAQWLLLSIARKSDRKAAKLMALMPPDRAAQLGQLYLDTDPDSIVQDDELKGGLTNELPQPSQPAPAAPAAPTTPAPTPAPTDSTTASADGATPTASTEPPPSGS